ncbi:Uncharacterized conserved protein YgbK, DUF1537 family [Halopelagius inordinatus]|uniref:Uncharacterized conserved protein YgbK, DUF1537 family n=1 Tax=Halopelagius inordinatus TaxID=553467 RepID=A0A1I2SZD6_9EURY|nr:four-carbon acid sugar kinase family protein [Halopelagius inordinatus]SFG55576.1 Uncharacterized conserved protein YgbK, DUF1537 family [Halopelagius inordinatus]
MSEPTVAFYGDDFTGSTDVLESLSRNGVDTVLFLDVPDRSDVERFGEVEAIGVAGTSRSMTPDEMDERLPAVFEALGEFDPELVQYKVCSTFDSSPTVGSIGRAIDIGQSVFDSPFVPVVVSAPSLEPRGRYVLFGTLFATVGDETYRIDRHPTMSEHPVTPMTEADLRDHLGEQTDRDIGLLDIRSIDGEEGADLDAALDDVVESDEIVFFDGLNRDHQRKVGRLVWERCESRGEDAAPLFSASSSGLDYALTEYWRSAGVVDASEPPTPADAVDRILVVSGSASPVTEAQIEWAVERGFEGIRLDTERLVDPEKADEARGEAIRAAFEALNAGRSPLLYSARGPDDPAIERTRARAEAAGVTPDRIGDRLGDQQGKITRTICAEAGLDRVCIAGGDTSGHVAPHLDIFALKFLSRVGPGGPLCRAASRETAFDGLEIALKGGQVQTTSDEADFFGAVMEGGAAR